MSASVQVFCDGEKIEAYPSADGRHPDYVVVVRIGESTIFMSLEQADTLSRDLEKIGKAAHYEAMAAEAGS
jgi:hypothetical protein